VCVYLLQATLSFSMVLRLTDVNKPAMYKLFYVVRETTDAFELSVESLNDLALFLQVMPHNRPFKFLLEDELEEGVLEHEAGLSYDNYDDVDDDVDDVDQFEGVPAL
jgi:hypothetical protein